MRHPLHPMGGAPADFLHLLRRYRRRARLTLPYGHPSGGMYIWYDSVGDDVAAPLVAREAARIAAALAALVAARLPQIQRLRSERPRRQPPWMGGRAARGAFAPGIILTSVSTKARTAARAGAAWTA